MKKLGLLLALLLGGAPSLLAQTTNGINTSAERQAAFDAATRSEAQQRNRAAGGSSSGGSSSGSSNVDRGRPMTNQESEAYMNALFGFKTREQKAAEARQNEQRYRDLQAAELRKQEARKAATAAERQAYDRAESQRITSMVPWDKLGFKISDCRDLGSLSTNSNPPAEMVQLLEQARTARPAFVALYAQPTATYESLRALAQQLPLREGKEYLYGINTAIEQYDQLYERFPARRATAAADLAQVVLTYFGWFRAFDQNFEPDVFRLKKVELLRKAVAANPALAHVAGMRLALNLKGKYVVSVRSSSSGKGTGGTIEPLRGTPLVNYLDTAMVGQLGHFAYAGCRHYLQNGQAATLGLTPDDVRHATGERAYELAELQLVQGQPAAARRWLRRALEADPTAEALQQGTADYYRLLLYEYPETFGTLQPAELPLLQKPLALAEPLRVKPVQAWLADTLRRPDDPRWQRLTAADRADLQQACDVAEWLTQGRPLLRNQLNAKRATWLFVLATGPGPNLSKAEKLWQQLAAAGDVDATRHLYRAYLLGDRLPARPEAELVQVVNMLSNTDGYSGHGHNQYLAAQLLLDELPGYPPLGKSFKKAGRKLVESAAVNGSPDAKERLTRKF